MKSLISLFLVAACYAKPEWTDCDLEKDKSDGPFTDIQFLNVTWNDTIFYGWVPTPTRSTKKFPLMTFMHGSTGQWEMYDYNLKHFASQGFVIVFPFVKSPEKDKNPFTTNTDGKFIIKGIDMAEALNDDKDSILYGKVDISTLIIAGHSMGATCSIMASKTALTTRPGSVKVTITQHPGICGPFGPPPSPDTWMKEDLNDITSAHPVLFTTATNDGAFWPAPMTAAHEYGCFEGGVADTAQAAFVQFSKPACIEDDDRKPFPDGGHDCPLKKLDGGRPENWWVLTAMKLYGQQGGSQSSKCYSQLWGNDENSLRNCSDVEKFDIRNKDTDLFTMALSDSDPVTIALQ